MEKFHFMKKFHLFVTFFDTFFDTLYIPLSPIPAQGGLSYIDHRGRRHRVLVVVIVVIAAPKKLPI